MHSAVNREMRGFESHPASQWFIGIWVLHMPVTHVKRVRVPYRPPYVLSVMVAQESPKLLVWVQILEDMPCGISIVVSISDCHSEGRSSNLLSHISYYFRVDKLVKSSAFEAEVWRFEAFLGSHLYSILWKLNISLRY